MAEMWIKTKSFFVQCSRVWKILKKPSKKEFETIAKVSAIGIGIIGVFGFLISILVKVLFK